MLMSRQLNQKSIGAAATGASTRHSPNTNMNIKFRQHISASSPAVNQSMSAANASSEMAGDSDAEGSLLHPMEGSSFDGSNASCTNSAGRDTRPERNLWRNDEIMEMLKIMQQINALEMLNDKTIKSERIFMNVQTIMNKRGYHKKSHVQIWTKWKFLKSTYMTSKRNCVIPKMVPYPIYEALGKMLSGGENSDCGNSATSMDGDNSNGALTIKSVEGGFGKSNDAEAPGNAEDNDFGMAHPIFGFRLGMVKSEPTDEGYENSINESADQESMLANEPQANSPSNSPVAANLQTAEIKQEIEDAFNSPSPPGTPLLEPQIEISAPVLKKPRTSLQATPNNPTPVHIQAANRGSTQMPPLRIAQFAKVPNINSNPPPLTMHSMAPSGVRAVVPNRQPTTNMMSSSSTPLRQMRMQQSLPQKIQMNNSNGNMPRMKQVPMRNTPYSLRPDRMIPDLDGSDSPPPLAQPYKPSIQQQQHQHNSYGSKMLSSNQSRAAHGNQPVPSMLIKQSDKRRVEYISPIMAAKMPRLHNGAHEFMNNSRAEEFEDNAATTQRQSFQEALRRQRQQQQLKQMQQHQQQKAQATSSPNKSNSSQKSRSAADNIEQTLRDFSNAMRNMQRELMQDFFEKQKELARKEHEFQMQQDRLIMQAFEEQSRRILKSAREVLGIEVLNKSSLKQTKKEDDLVADEKPDTQAAATGNANSQTLLEMQRFSQNLQNEYVDIAEDDDDDDDDDDEQVPDAEEDDDDGPEDSFLIEDSEMNTDQQDSQSTADADEQQSQMHNEQQQQNEASNDYSSDEEQQVNSEAEQQLARQDKGQELEADVAK